MNQIKSTNVFMNRLWRLYAPHTLTVLASCVYLFLSFTTAFKCNAVGSDGPGFPLPLGGPGPIDAQLAGGTGSGSTRAISTGRIQRRDARSTRQ